MSRKKSKKRLIGFIAPIVLVGLFLAGCNHGSDGANSSSANSNSPTTTVATTQTTTLSAHDLAQSIKGCIPAQNIDSELNNPVLKAWLDGKSGRKIIAKFTTCYEAGKGRVKNIERIADLTRGAIINPNQTFSLNSHIGRRTIENGFVIADALSTTEGLFGTVGGGISQFTTALFNAAFFAGLDIPKSQPHTFHFPRYPYGREATINWSPPIELAIRNNTQSDVLIWTSYTPDQTTVFIVGVPYIEEVKELPQRQEPYLSNCTKVTITRQRTYPDDTTRIDTFLAFYQSKLGEPCG